MQSIDVWEYAGSTMAIWQDEKGFIARVMPFDHGLRQCKGRYDTPSEARARCYGMFAQHLEIMARKAQEKMREIKWDYTEFKKEELVSTKHGFNFALYAKPR